ncbi:MAG: hypothetical protein K2Q26_03535 [Bdellovibrionales bacterium]|nr:hypothetical protein [Bdellovibrionales bacterium]
MKLFLPVLIFFSTLNAYSADKMSRIPANIINNKSNRIAKCDVTSPEGSKAITADLLTVKQDEPISEVIGGLNFYMMWDKKNNLLKAGALDSSANASAMIISERAKVQELHLVKDGKVFTLSCYWQ